MEKLLKSKLLIAGLVFLGVNLWASYMFYQVNSYKIAMVVLGVSLMAILCDLVFPGNVEKKTPWKLLGILALPLIATIPGFIWHQGGFNYNFRYELAASLILIVWVSYLYRGVKNEEDLSPFIFLIGITILYASLWAMLERIGYHPLFWDSLPVDRVKSTFGNINYFAGFLVVIIPLFLALSVPEKIFSISTIREIPLVFTKSHFF
ncbi:hypothetical protein KKA14_04305, partial [bacterium]|nr:hypothetical protein [bacterium]